MGAAMCPAAADTIMAHFKDTGRSADDYDILLLLTWVLSGSTMLIDLLRRNNIDV